MTLFSGCGNRSGSIDGESIQQNLTPVEGGIIKLACFVPDTLNPFVTKYQNVRDVLMIVYEGLFKAESTLEAIPVLAESYSVSTANKIYTVKLPPKFTQRDLQSFTRVMCIEEGEITKLSLALNWH